MSEKRFCRLTIALLGLYVLPLSIGHASCLITILAQNTGNADIAFNTKMSKATVTDITPRIWKKVFDGKSVKKKKHIVPKRTTNYAHVFKATNKCKRPRVFKFVIEKNACQKAFDTSVTRQRYQGWNQTGQINLGDLAKKCK